MRPGARLLFALLFAAGLGLGGTAQAQPLDQMSVLAVDLQPQPYPPFTAVKLSDDLWEIPGSGSNSNVMVLVTDEGLILVDVKYEYQYDDLIKIIREKVSTKPIKYVIDTHYHADHSGANVRFLKDGVQVISSTPAREDILAKKQPGAPAGMAPANVTFTGEMRLYLGGKEVRIRHYGPGHTNSDVVVYFPQDRVLCVGDLAHIGDLERGGQYPLIDYLAGGSIGGWIERLNSILADYKFDRVMSGHGALGTPADIVAYRDILERVRTDVRTFLADGTKTQGDLRTHLNKGPLHWPDPGFAMVRGLHGLYADLKP